MSKKNSAKITAARKVNDSTFELNLEELLEKKNGVSQFTKLNTTMNLSKRIGKDSFVPENYIREVGKQFYDFTVAGDPDELVTFKNEFKAIFGIDLVYAGFEEVFGKKEKKVKGKDLGKEHTHEDQKIEVETATDVSEEELGRDVCKLFRLYNEDDVKGMAKLCEKYGYDLEKDFLQPAAEDNTVIQYVTTEEVERFFRDGRKAFSKWLKETHKWDRKIKRHARWSNFKATVEDTCRNIKRFITGSIPYFFKYTLPERIQQAVSPITEKYWNIRTAIAERKEAKAARKATVCTC